MLGLLRGGSQDYNELEWERGKKSKDYLFPNVRQTRPKEGDWRAKECAGMEEELSSEGKFKEATGDWDYRRVCMITGVCVCVCMGEGECGGLNHGVEMDPGKGSGLMNDQAAQPGGHFIS